MLQCTYVSDMFSFSLVTTEIRYYLWCSGQDCGNLGMNGSFFWCRLSSWGGGGGGRKGERGGRGGRGQEGGGRREGERGREEK